MNKYQLYEELKKNDKQIECDECKTLLSDIKIATDKVRNEKNEMMEVTYFACPECKKVYVISIRDRRAKQLAACYELTIKKLDFFRKKRKEPPTHLINASVVAKQNYITHQNFLKRRYGRYFNLKTRK